MQAISLKQPWAQLIVIGVKHAETRSWPTEYRGEIAVHASKAFPNWMRAETWNNEMFREPLNEAGFGPKDLPLGAIVGTVEITGCYRSEEAGSMGIYHHSLEWRYGDYTPGRWFWTLANPVMWDKPKPCRGALKIGTVPEQISI